MTQQPFFVTGLVFLVLCCSLGCVATTIQPPSAGVTKETLTLPNTWDGPPVKIYRDPAHLKFGADEVWSYESSAGIKRYYFKGDVLVQEEKVTYDTL